MYNSGMILTQLILILIGKIWASSSISDKKLNASIYRASRWFDPSELTAVIEAVILKPDSNFWSLHDYINSPKQNTDDEFTACQSELLLIPFISGPKLRVGQQYNLVYELCSPKLPVHFESLQLLYRILSDPLNHELAHRDPSPLSYLFSDLPHRPPRVAEFVWVLAMAGSCPTPELHRAIHQEIHMNPGKESLDLRACLDILECCKIARL